MAKVTFHPSISGLSGKLDRLTYRQQHGQTVVVAPYERKDRPSTAQRQGRARFKAAQAYAKSVLADPLKQELYRRVATRLKRPPNALLIANFLNPPVIERVDLAAFRGRVGSLVRVLATDPIAVSAVSVTALDAKGTVLETGTAENDHDVWVYRCTTALAGAATKLEVTAENRAGAKAATTVAL